MKNIFHVIALCFIVLVSVTSCNPESISDTKKEQVQANDEGNTQPRLPEPEPNP
ncbi:hypothetical protein [Flavivirga sp. 57AJ16]|uniref:hypothetical protein n=1 Tax=Flavivirga sp. 57AJ16 TaxID=3025307 RepID=UPI0023668D73|nr:hypothetical protein [Flavivirga sp. 57AJ16]MDD7887116.1 hypothetical protein [Flavivirga sp. 57AJ16]